MFRRDSPTLQLQIPTTSGQRSPNAGKRSGLTLIELLLAGAILAAALGTLMHQNAIGVLAARRCQFETEAAILCQTQLALLKSQITPIRSIAQAPIPGRSPWNVVVQLQSCDVKGLCSVTVTVFRDDRFRELSVFRLTTLIPIERTEPL